MLLASPTESVLLSVRRGATNKTLEGNSWALIKIELTELEFYYCDKLTLHSIA